MDKTNVRLVSALLLVLLIMMSGCSKKNEQSKKEINSPETAAIVEEQQVEEKGIQEEETIKVVETEPTEGYSLEGSYTLEDARRMTGIYLAFEDGSFDRYKTGGYCNGLTKSSTDFNGYYASNSMLLQIPTYVTAEDELAVFSDKDFKISLHPINFEVGAIEFVSENGVAAYGHCNYLFNDSMNVSVHYDNHDSEVIDVLYVDGVAPSAYPLEVSELVVHPYKGMKSKEEIARYYSFPRGGSVTLSTAQGTTLVEQTYDVSATYFDLQVNRNDWDVVDYYFLDCKPTTEGYAKIEMYDSWQGVSIPAGKYVMVFKTDSTYMATIINWAG